jgi:hypothetical protein
MLVLVACPNLYPWAAAPNDNSAWFQSLWLSRPFFLLRALAYLACWLGLARLLVRASRKFTA